MKFKILFAAAAIFFSQVVFAHISCPLPQKMKNVSFDEVQKGDHPDVWTLLQNNKNYSTPYKWTFSMMVEATSKADALKKGKRALLTMKKHTGPEKQDSVWICDYSSSQALAAIATMKNN